MKDQMLIGPLVELPGWLQAAGWGLLSSTGLLIGALGGYYTWLQHTVIARVMTFAAGVLLAGRGSKNTAGTSWVRAVLPNLTKRYKPFIC